MPSTAAIVPIQRVTTSVRDAGRVGWRSGVTFVAAARSAVRAGLRGATSSPSVGSRNERGRTGSGIARKSLRT